jgi:hypothetical protein
MTGEANDKTGKPERKPKSRRAGQVVARGKDKWLVIS